MEFLLNDRSLHAQYHDPASFCRALDVVMALRKAARHAGRDVSCHRNILNVQACTGQTLQQVASGLRRDQRIALLLWVTQQGPFWDDVRAHESDDWLEWRGDIVTDTALGEAAFAIAHGVDRHLVSFAPSDLAHHPVAVDWRRDDHVVPISVPNHWETGSLQRALDGAPSPITSWSALETQARNRFDALFLAATAFTPLRAQPFHPAAAGRVLFLLATLDRYRRCFGDDGTRSREGHRLYQDFFTGKKGQGGRGALFSDSSDTEKAEFESGLRFPHPERAGETLFCPWHGKVQTPALRVHFSYPIRSNEALYVVYVGPKLTKR